MPLSSLSSPARRLAALALLPLVGTAALVAAAPTARAVDISSPVVISEVYGGGGNSGAPFTNDFIELYNKGTTAVDLSTWSVQYASSAGTAWTNRTNLTGTIQPQAYYLIQEASGRHAQHAAADPRRRRHDRHERNGWQGGAREEPGQPRVWQRL